MMAAAEAAAPVVNMGKIFYIFFCQNIPPQTLVKPYLDWLGVVVILTRVF
jgi:hypothetical protein